jgi:16S rRNA (adenine1518-N6/adenine1519-N6)-dimethyltransferase
MSAVVNLTPDAAPADVSLPVLERLTAAAFGQRRKMLRQSLKGIPGALDALRQLDIDPTRRAETIGVAQFVALARLLGSSPHA